jgi:hypothetical protein
MKLRRNPFRYGADFDLDDIVGRKDKIVLAERAIRDGQRLFLSGPRGCGKSLSCVQRSQTCREKAPLCCTSMRKLARRREASRRDCC